MLQHGFEPVLSTSCPGRPGIVGVEGVVVAVGCGVSADEVDGTHSGAFRLAVVSDVLSPDTPEERQLHFPRVHFKRFSLGLLILVRRPQLGFASCTGDRQGSPEDLSQVVNLCRVHGDSIRHLSTFRVDVADDLEVVTTGQIIGGRVVICLKQFD